MLLGQVFPVCLWPPVTLLSPADGAQGVALDPTFEVQIGGGAPAPMNCTLDGVRWQIALDEGFALNAVVFDTGSDAGVNTRFRPLLRIFVPGTTYHVRVQLLSDSGISNTWSDPSSFTTESDEVPPPPGPPEPPPQPPAPPPPPGPGVPALGCALDANANDRLDDDEILAAVRLWITGEVVPGASGRAIDDDAMLDFVRRWIGGEALGCAGPAGRR